MRGQFPNTPDAILARAQRRDDTGSKGTFGTRLQRAEIDSDLELGERKAQGWVNFRWPYTQYELKRKGGEWGEHTGTCEEISFIRDGTVCHLMRLRWGHGSSMSEYSSSTDSQERQTIQLKFGGFIQFGCPCSNGSTPSTDTFQLKPSSSAGTMFTCSSEKYEKRLDMQLFVNGIEQNFSAQVGALGGDAITGKEVNTSSTYRIELSVGEPICIVSTYSLRSSREEPQAIHASCFADLQDHLGIAITSVNMSDRLWTALCSTNYEASEAVEFCVLGRCVEQILCVSSIPFAATPESEQSSTFEALQNKDGLENTQKASETVLLCNIITPQFVDVQSALYRTLHPPTQAVLAYISPVFKLDFLSKLLILSALVILNSISCRSSDH